MKLTLLIVVSVLIPSLEYAQQSYRLERSAIISAGNIAKSSSYTLVNGFGMPHPGTMENAAFVVGPYTGVEDTKDGENVPKTYAFEQNYPNPFNSSTTFAYSLPELSDVTLSVYSVLGQKVATLESQQQPAGRYTLVFKGMDDSGHPLPSGLYLCSLRANKFSKTVKFIIAR